MNATFVRLARVSIALLLGMALSGAHSASAQDATSSIEIHNRVCPVEYAGDDLFGDCHDNPVADMEFAIDGPVDATQSTDAAGNTTFVDLPAGSYEMTGGAPGDFADAYIYCSLVDDPDTVFVETTDYTPTIDLPAGTAVVCDWYNIPLDLRGDDGGSTTLPSTGVAPMSGGVAVEWWLALAAAGAGALAIGLRRRPAC